ncbi:MAG: flagellar basal body rod protein FlgB [Deltaproteobacteria bacterium]|nr:flagellar basal body rod protein FlgB [Deltaproteobacteria bacterium]
MKSIFSDHIAVVSKVMDFRLQRQNVVAANLANINTKDYKPQRLEFEKEIQTALNTGGRMSMARTDQEHIPAPFDPKSTNAQSLDQLRARKIQGADTVDLDEEMAVMAKNTLAYKALSTILHSNFEGLKTIITEGGK